VGTPLEGTLFCTWTENVTTQPSSAAEVNTSKVLHITKPQPEKTYSTAQPYDLLKTPVLHSA
jgi:hypothetical protein